MSNIGLAIISHTFPAYDDDMKARKMVEAVALVTLVSAITRVIAFVFKIYLSRELGAEVLGVYQITMSIFILFMSLSSSGIPTALSRHLAERYAEHDTNGARGMLTSALILSSVISLIIIALCYIFPHTTALLFNDERCAEMFFIMLPALFSTGVYAIVRSYFWGNKEYLLYSVAELIEELLTIFIVVTCIVVGLYHDNMSKCVAVAFVISDYVGMALLVVLFAIRGGRVGKPTLMRPLVASALPMTSTRLLGSIVSSMMALIIPIMLVRSGIDTGNATASYGRASGMVMSLIFTPSTIVGSLAIVVMPELASSHTTANKHLDKVIAPALSFAVIVACLFLSLFISVGDRLCTFLYDDNIAGGYMLVASLIMLPMSINQIAVSVLNTMGHENSTFLVHVVASIVLGLLIVILPKHIGIYAYFVALIVFHTLSAIIYIHMLNNEVKLNKNELMLYVRTVIFALIVGFGLKMCHNIIKNDMIAVIICSIVILILYAIFLTKIKLIDVNIIKGKLVRKSS